MMESFGMAYGERLDDTSHVQQHAAFSDRLCKVIETTRQ